MRRLSFISLLVFIGFQPFGQVPPDSITPLPDTLMADAVVRQPLLINRAVSQRPAKDSSWPVTNPSSAAFIYGVLQHHPYYAFDKNPLVAEQPSLRKVTGKELLFYSLMVLLLAFAILKRMFSKYFSDLFRLFFRTTLKHKQVREQLMQTPLPSLLLNGFFVVSAAFYVCFLAQYFKTDPTGNFWLLFLYAAAALSAVYFIKFIGLKLSGWVFGMQEAANSYVFIVFIINKMIGILLIPFLFVLAFSTGVFYTVGLSLSWVVVVGLLAYRIILTWGAVRGQVKVNLFHFFIYLLAFEVAPLLLLYKGLLLFFSQTA